MITQARVWHVDAVSTAARRARSGAASVAFLRQELEHHKRDTATHFARVAADLDVAAQLRRIEDKLERRSNT